MGTNEIVTEIISSFIKELEDDDSINKELIKKVTLPHES
jgi:hypothetical protein